jgi:signal transduction histidine kinase
MQARNAELDELRLAAEQARDQAERLAAARAAFLATMSHEVRTPLHGICGAAELLGRVGLSGRALELQQALERSAAGLKRIVDDVLDLARLEKGSVLIGAQEMEIEEVLQTLLMEFLPLAFQKGLEIRLEVAPNSPGRIVSDPGRIRQVMAVLLANAIKFTDEGLVRIRLGPLAEGGLRVEVDDEGPGIPIAFREVVFDAFRQVDHSASRAQEGTGLGLAIGRQLANAMGGSLRVEDGDLRGARVVFALPCPILADFPALPAGAPMTWGAVGLAPDVLESARVVFTILGIAEDQPAKLMVCGGKMPGEVTLGWNGGAPQACALPLSPTRIRS